MSWSLHLEPRASDGSQHTWPRRGNRLWERSRVASYCLLNIDPSICRTAWQHAKAAGCINAHTCNRVLLIP